MVEALHAADKTGNNKLVLFNCANDVLCIITTEISFAIENKHPDLNNVNIGVLDVTIGGQL